MTATFRDTLVTCPECGKTFVLTVEKQRKAAEAGSTAAGTCESCTRRVQYRGKHHGRLKWYSTEKGYGFITSDEGRDIFFHRDGLLAAPDRPLPEPNEGQDLLYEVMETTRGQQAFNVEPL